MIYCSSLPNDEDMIKALGSMAVPMPSLFTDCCFSGSGDNSIPILIAVERKKISDIVSCIITGRFMSQFQVCKEMGCTVMVIIVEGDCRPSPTDGLLEVPGWDPIKCKKGWIVTSQSLTYSRFDQYLTELDYLAGVIVKRSGDVRETAAIIKALWDNFQKPPDRHASLHQMFSAPNPKNSVELYRPGLARRIGKELPGVGWTRSREVAKHFGTVLNMANATEEEWTQVPGIGKKIAGDVYRDIRRKNS
jgi:ERCC4-type nuclease